MYLKSDNDVEDHDERPTILAVERAAILLRIIGRKKEPCGVRELARETGYSPSNTQKLLNALAKHGLVQRDERTSLYTLGLESFRFSVSMLEQTNLHEITRPILNDLMARSEETAYLTLLNPELTRCVVVDRIDCKNLLRTTAYLGSWCPLNTSADGKATLACLPDKHLDYLQEQDQYHPDIHGDLVDLDTLREDLIATRKRGYAFADNENAEGVRGLAAPLLNADEVVGSISVDGPEQRMTDDRIPLLGTLITEAGLVISQRLGYDDAHGFYAPHRPQEVE